MEARLGWLGIGMLVLGSTAGCGSGDSAHPASPPKKVVEAPTPSVLTGQVEGTDARLAIVATARHARVYFCGGDSSYQVLSRWVPADIESDGQLMADEALSAGWAVRATLDGDTMSGSPKASPPCTPTALSTAI